MAATGVNLWITKDFPSPTDDFASIWTFFFGWDVHVQIGQKSTDPALFGNLVFQVGQ